MDITIVPSIVTGLPAGMGWLAVGRARPATANTIAATQKRIGTFRMTTEGASRSRVAFRETPLPRRVTRSPTSLDDHLGRRRAAVVRFVDLAHRARIIRARQEIVRADGRVRRNGYVVLVAGGRALAGSETRYRAAAAEQDVGAALLLVGREIVLRRGRPGRDGALIRDRVGDLEAASSLDRRRRGHEGRHDEIRQRALEGVCRGAGIFALVALPVGA